MKLLNQYRENIFSKTTEKRNSVIICRILFFGCFFVAVILANTVWENEAAWVGYMHQNLLRDTFVGIERYGNCWNILFHRLPVWICLIVLGQSKMGILVANVYAGWEGMLLGLAMSVMVMQYGLLGIVIIFLLIFPQWFAYVTSYVFIYQFIFRIWTKRNYFVVISTFFTGIFLESYVNVIFLSKILEIVKKI